MKTEMKELNHLWTDIYYQMRYNHHDNITHQSVRILQVIEKEKDVGVKKIAEKIQVSHNTASEHIKRLMERKYVYKTRSKVDERKVILLITEEGQKVLHQHSSLSEEKLQHVFEIMTDQEKEMVLTAFKLMKERIDHVYPI
ncbi:MarR family winged helix-turn-helix transcriptional regulator [Alkalicoccobacillus murimartini]|uniref:HTH-type transcriptional regulator SarZ n=1 Tax=Alkalicoccobacillus murimartini TaxID=171685 RepID=A0ABT9YC02_9BACI|nr:MarR family winged helix-turn-helix transcriptional regulator [Alkalicoccobacillus murimartini]MDQ0205370.1 DNA-binding MarR family transcriptional regulator [Alkalicoccobacillus murimartini]